MSRSNNDKPFYEVKVVDALKARKVMERVHKFLGILIRENLVKDAPFLKEGEIENESDLADDVWEVLQGVPRNCDIGTAEEQVARQKRWCATTRDYSCADIMCRSCFAKWSQMPYKEVGDK